MKKINKYNFEDYVSIRQYVSDSTKLDIIGFFKKQGYDVNVDLDKAIRDKKLNEYTIYYFNNNFYCTSNHTHKYLSFPPLSHFYKFMERRIIDNSKSKNIRKTKLGKQLIAYENEQRRKSY